MPGRRNLVRVMEVFEDVGRHDYGQGCLESRRGTGKLRAEQ